jgi:predicted dinucleotide-binding enzyme
MKIAVLGAGNVGGALARLWTQAGHQVQTARRQAGPTPEEIAADAAVVALCVPGGESEQALVSCGDVTGKIVIDCTNPLAPDLQGLLYGGTTSAGERLQQLRPGARVVKAFNSVGAGLLGSGEARGRQADGFYCGDNAEAKRLVEQLIVDAKLHPVDVGPLRNARYLESLAMLWIDLAVNQKRGGAFAFNLVDLP